MSQRSGALIYYVGVLDGAGGVWGVRVPDIPGCVGGGATADPAITDAAEALRAVAAYKCDGGFDIPLASTLTEIVASGEIGEGESAVMIPLLIDWAAQSAPMSASTRRCSTRSTQPQRNAA